MAEKIKIGWIGLGKMGNPMALNLVKAGFPLTVYNRSVEKTRQLDESGANVVGTIAELVALSDLVITMISDDDALKEIVYGVDGILSYANSGVVLVDMSTVSPEASSLVSNRCKEKGVIYLSAPVLGSTKVASDAALTILVSGPKSAFEAIEDLFDVLGKKIAYLGAEQEARYLKLVINGMLGITAIMLGETLMLGERGGLDWEQMLDFVSDGPAGSPVIKVKLDGLKKREIPVAFTASQMAKDCDLVINAGKELNLPMPMTEMVRKYWRIMEEQGVGESDFFAFALNFEKLLDKIGAD